ncbi:DUF2388 domain-containing protein [Pseudomonas sp. ZM23]|uniref:DUF2388 domain-containing protein n=1 Tax=Pseudomonas triclosanedens TaxID=2961893 RepID=A0ABY7A1H5_9PSED|nr:DUF2388 domain-containing protein [Pseudomonas triclosanedens]MCP8462864.1 DUF2388 domain-containing protein [Pseudomonas triclosanedens]MCP8468484.1 DUF2388 domain-containing protein [Pseudomonas triclosanedens]MCP8475206.1 DUF2388 domain-containing protein [Pseudomonas triclosanedens]WAI50043.1 DUF2388 domain-containing protein [Pseudomonas triclosanedens]
MRTAKLATAFALLALPLAPAFADGFWRDIISSGATTASTYLTFRHDHKLIVAAQDDAGAYVASDGAIRGPYLEAALTRLRSDDSSLRQRSDMELANAILARDDDEPPH